MNFGLFRKRNRIPALTCLLLLLCPFAHAQEAEFIWSKESGSGTEIILSSYADGAWLPGERIVRDQNLNILPAMGMNNQGDKLAVWSTVSATGSILKFNLKRGGSWQGPQVLTGRLSTNLAPVVVYDNSDIAWVFWSANNGDDDDIYMSRLVNGTWTPAQRVHTENDVPDILAQAGQDEHGNVWVTWQQLQDDAYVELTQSYESQSKRKMAPSGGLRNDKIRQMKQRSDLANTIEPPEFFQARSRATLYFPNNKHRPSVPVEGNIH